MAGRVTTPYCSGLSLLPSGRFRWVAGWLTCNHPLLFGTVSPTNERGYVSTPGPVSNHPLLFGTVSPTRSSHPRVWVQRKVTTPYCSGLSLLPMKLWPRPYESTAVTTPYCSGLSLLHGEDGAQDPGQAE